MQQKYSVPKKVSRTIRISIHTISADIIATTTTTNITNSGVVRGILTIRLVGLGTALASSCFRGV
jgi:hypothetical protein